MQGYEETANELPKHTTVLIVGAGLVAALTLQARGIDCVLVDQNAPGRNITRAMSLASFALEILSHLGLSDELMARANPASKLTASNRKEVYATFDLEPGLKGHTPFTYMACLPQRDTEAVLVEGYEKRGGQVYHPFGFVKLEEPTTPQDDWTVELGDGKDRRTIRCKYLIAADGMKSQVRNALGVDWSADDLIGVQGVLIDAYLSNVGDALPKSNFNGHFSSHGHLIVAAHKEEGLYRLAAAMPDGVQKPLEVEEVQELLNYRGPVVQTPIKVERLEWSSRAMFHEQVAQTFIVSNKRGFLVGDAAHIHSPAGGQGLNLAFADSFFLAETLARIIKLGASPDDLDRWAAARKAVAERVIHFSGLMLRRMISSLGADPPVNPFAPPHQPPPGAPSPAFVQAGLVQRPKGWDGFAREMQPLESGYVY